MGTYQGIKLIEDDFCSSAHESIRILEIEKGRTFYSKSLNQNVFNQEKDRMWECGHKFVEYYRLSTNENISPDADNEHSRCIEQYISSNKMMLSNAGTCENWREMPSSIINELLRAYTDGLQKSYERKTIELKPQKTPAADACILTQTA